MATLCLAKLAPLVVLPLQPHQASAHLDLPASAVEASKSEVAFVASVVAAFASAVPPASFVVAAFAFAASVVAASAFAAPPASSAVVASAAVARQAKLFAVAVDSYLNVAR